MGNENEITVFLSGEFEIMSFIDSIGDLGGEYDDRSGEVLFFDRDGEKIYLSLGWVVISDILDSVKEIVNTTDSMNHMFYEMSSDGVTDLSRLINLEIQGGE